MMKMLSAVLLVLGMFLHTAFAQTTQKPVAVSVHVLPPFVEVENGQFGGFSIELWNDIAARLHWTSHFVVAGNVGDQLRAVATHETDVGVGAISITAARDAAMDFSQPILGAGLQIMVRRQNASHEPNVLSSLMHLLLSPAVVVWLGIAALLTIIPAHIVWLAERNHPEGMITAKGYPAGITQAFFWGLGTLATQADAMPRHWVSRIVAVLWMFTGVVFVAFYTATLTANLTVQRFRHEVSGPGDLPGLVVGAVSDTTSASYLRDNNLQFITFPTVDGAYQALLNKDIDAIVYDAPVLQFVASHIGAGRVSVVGDVFEPQDYGFAFANGSDLRRQVDATLLALREDGTYDKLTSTWFGK